MATRTAADRIRERQHRRARRQQLESGMALVHRQCLVCEWEGDEVEPVTPPEPAPSCPWCHAPTKRLATDPIVVPAGGKRVGKNPHAAALGRLGGLKGGVARAAALTPKQRREIAVKAARTRWRKK